MPNNLAMSRISGTDSSALCRLLPSVSRESPADDVNSGFPPIFLMILLTISRRLSSLGLIGSDGRVSPTLDDSISAASSRGPLFDAHSDVIVQLTSGLHWIVRSSAVERSNSWMVVQPRGGIAENAWRPMRLCSLSDSMTEGCSFHARGLVLAHPNEQSQSVDFGEILDGLAEILGQNGTLASTVSLL